MKNIIKLSPFAGALFIAAIAMLGPVMCPADPPGAPPATPPLQNRGMRPMPDPQAAPPAPAPSALSQPAAIKADAVNYIVRVEWKDAQGRTNFLQVVTVEGSFKMNTAQRYSVKINNAEVPVIITFNGRLTVLGPEKGQLDLLLGKKEPFVTGASAEGRTSSPVSSYQYCDLGLNSTVVVTFGKPLVIQTDENGEVTLLVKREEN